MLFRRPSAGKSGLYRITGQQQNRRKYGHFRTLHRKTRRQAQSVFRRENQTRRAQGLPFGRQLRHRRRHHVDTEPRTRVRRHERRRDSESGRSGADGRALLRGGQELHALPPETHRRARRPRETRISDQLLRRLEPGDRLEIRRQRQRRKQEHRHADRRAAETELHPPEPPPADRPHQGDVRQGAVGQIPAPAQGALHLQERRDVDGQLLRLDHHVSVALGRHALGGRQLDPSDESQIVLRRIRQHGFHRVVDAFGRMRHARIPDVHELFHRAGVRRRLLQAGRRGGRPLEKTPHDRQDNHRLLRTDRLLDQPADRGAQLPSRVLERGLLRPLLLRKPVRGVRISRRFASALGVAVVAAEAFHEVVQPRAHQDRADFPGRDDGAADQRRRRDGPGVGRHHGADVRRGALVLHLYQRQRRLAVELLPPAERDSGQRVQLHARRGRRLDRLEERADDQPQPLHPVRREERHALSHLSGRDHGSGTQSADGLQRKPQGTEVQRHAAALRCGLHQPFAPIPDHRRKRTGRSRRISGNPHRRQRRLRRFRAERTGADRALQQEIPHQGADVQLRDDPRRKRRREARQMGPRGRIRRAARLLQLLFLRRRGPVAERRRQIPAARTPLHRPPHGRLGATHESRRAPFEGAVPPPAARGRGRGLQLLYVQHSQYGLQQVRAYRQTLSESVSRMP